MFGGECEEFGQVCWSVERGVENVGRGVVTAPTLCYQGIEPEDL